MELVVGTHHGCTRVLGQTDWDLQPCPHASPTTKRLEVCPESTRGTGQGGFGHTVLFPSSLGKCVQDIQEVMMKSLFPHTLTRMFLFHFLWWRRPTSTSRSELLGLGVEQTGRWALCCGGGRTSQLLMGLCLSVLSISRKHQDSKKEEEKKKPHIKKPLNAFMLYMKEMRAKVVAECTLKESAAINQILGRRVRSSLTGGKNGRGQSGWPGTGALSLQSHPDFLSGLHGGMTRSPHSNNILDPPCHPLP